MKPLNFLLTALTVSSLSVAGLSGSAQAQTNPVFPAKAVTLVIPFTPGSGSDLIARIIFAEPRYLRTQNILRRPDKSGLWTRSR